MPVYNTPGEWILEAVASVEDARLSWAELILTNDGSSSRSTLEALQQVEARGYEVLHIENSGVSVARNRAIEAARGEYILPLDADDLLGLGFCPVAADVLDMQPDVAVVAGVLESFGARTIRICPDVTVSLAQILLQNTVCATSMFRKAVWMEVGGFDESLRRGHQDAELWIRIAARGGGIVGLPETAVRYRTGHDSMTGDIAESASEAMTDAIINNNEAHYATLLRAALESTDLLRPQAEAAHKMRDLWVRYERLDRLLGTVPGAKRALASLNHSLARWKP
ncbi:MULTISPECIES: glycosyltransferase family 2 protein [unclassified Pseudoclavibacter]|uniref:glycosyltransferase family 2 protein n=1 Tax=unclassified Pseudoclavibacter TaxID=2615177 RepID=UPI001BA7DBC0|nr:glycosyltransferase family 2 protein [Pseudoclavibacter sp. Marseille-Q4354]